jgi:lysozyme family protein
LKKGEAKEIYRLDYWKHGYEEILNERLALLLFDFGVNAGVRRSVRIIQQLVDVENDGVFGPVTLKAVNAHNQVRLLRDYAVRVAMYYFSLDMQEFLKGWIKRLMDNMTRSI